MGKVIKKRINVAAHGTYKSPVKAYVGYVGWSTKKANYKFRRELQTPSTIFAAESPSTIVRST